jgi:hypothetical protein
VWLVPDYYKKIDKAMIIDAAKKYSTRNVTVQVMLFSGEEIGTHASACKVVSVGLRFCDSYESCV